MGLARSSRPTLCYPRQTVSGRAEKRSRFGPDAWSFHPPSALLLLLLPNDKDNLSKGRNMLDQIMVEYDELVSDIQGSGYQTFAHNLQRWLSFLDSSTSLAGILPQLELPVDFNTWYEKCLR